MRTLHLYLTRQMLATLGMTVAVFTLVLLLGNVVHDILPLVIKRQITLGVALQAIALLMPFVLAFSLPIGMLTAALLVFGRFSADQELTAARASGISLLSLVAPVLLLSVAVSGLCAWLNCDVAPTSRMASKELLYRAVLNKPADLLQSMESTPLGDCTIYVGKRHADGTNFDNIIVTQYDKNGQLVEWLHGDTGTIISDLAHHELRLNLQNEEGMRLRSDGWDPFSDNGVAAFPIKVEPQAQKALPLPISDMTFRQLLEERERIERQMTAPLDKGKNKAQLQEMQKEFGDIMITPVLVYLHRAAAFSFACIGFTLVGIPLGIRGHRRETSAGVAMALILMLVYYSFIVLGQAWASHAERAPYLIVWVPDFIFQAVGAVLLWRANRGL